MTKIEKLEKLQKEYRKHAKTCDICHECLDGLVSCAKGDKLLSAIVKLKYGN